jgi:hypothetical protein
MSAEMFVPKVGIHRLTDVGRSLQKYEDQACLHRQSNVVRSYKKKPESMWTIGFVQRTTWFGDNPCRKYTENQGICDRKKTCEKYKKTIRFMHSQYRKYKEN